MVIGGVGYRCSAETVFCAHGLAFLAKTQYHRYPQKIPPKEAQTMPVVRKLAPEEVQTLEYKPKGQRKLVEEQYDAFLTDYDVGDHGEAALEDGENRLTVRNRFKAAATRRGLDLEFRRTIGDTLRFKVIPASDDGHAPEAAVEAAPAPSKGKGRKKQTA